MELMETMEAGFDHLLQENPMGETSKVEIELHIVVLSRS